MRDRLDEEQLETLRTWGEGLTRDGRDELRAAGRAILMLVEEIEFLNVDLWHVRQVSTLETEGSTAGLAERRLQLGLALRARIDAVRHRRSSASPEH